MMHSPVTRIPAWFKAQVLSRARSKRQRIPAYFVRGSLPIISLLNVTRILTSLVLLLLWCAVAPAQSAHVSSLSNEQLLQKADEAFARGLVQKDNPDKARQYFEMAMRDYRELADRGVRSVALFRNLGNAAYLADHLSEAILAWRQGLELSPGDPDMRANLDYARKQVTWPPSREVYPPPFLWPVGVPYPSMLQVFVILLVFFTLMCATFTRWRMIRHSSWLLASLASLVMCILVAASLIALYAQQINNREHPIAVIAAERIPFRRGNGESYPENEKVPYLYRGMEARLLFKRDDWLQIEFAGGQVGWIPDATALFDVSANHRPVESINRKARK